MIYGMYRSAAGIMTSSHRQDVIANNLANTDTNGFRRNLASFRERPMAADELPGGAARSNPFYTNLGGGTLVMPTQTDLSPGAFELTSNRTDVALSGRGMLVVERNGQQFLTRNGAMLINSQGNLVLANDPSARVLNNRLRPIRLPVGSATDLNVASDGSLAVGGRIVTRLAVKELRPGGTVTKQQGTLLEAGNVATLPDSRTTTVVQGMVEMSNVEPTSELTAMIEAQRALEANANILRMQDATLQRLVNEVGKIT